MPASAGAFNFYLGTLGSLPTDKEIRLTQFYASGPECLAAVERAKKADPYTRLRVWERNRLGQWSSINQWVF